MEIDKLAAFRKMRKIGDFGPYKPEKLIELLQNEKELSYYWKRLCTPEDLSRALDKPNLKINNKWYWPTGKYHPMLCWELLNLPNTLDYGKKKGFNKGVPLIRLFMEDKARYKVSTLEWIELTTERMLTSFEKGQLPASIPVRLLLFIRYTMAFTYTDTNLLLGMDSMTGRYRTKGLSKTHSLLNQVCRDYISVPVEGAYNQKGTLKMAPPNKINGRASPLTLFQRFEVIEWLYKALPGLLLTPGEFLSAGQEDYRTRHQTRDDFFTLVDLSQRDDFYVTLF